MNETIKVIKSRRSVRQYQEKQVAQLELQVILEAGIYAPNAGNQQQWHFSVVQNREMIDTMANIIRENILNSGPDFLKEMAKAPGYHVFHHAPTVVMITGDGKAPFNQVNGGAAAENMALAAESLNIGSNVMTSPDFLFKSEKGNALRKDLGIPEGYVYICTVTLGYKKGETPVKSRNMGVITYL